MLSCNSVVIYRNKFKRGLAIDEAVDLQKRGVKFLNKHLRPLLNLYLNSLMFSARSFNSQKIFVHRCFLYDVAYLLVFQVFFFLLWFWACQAIRKTA